MLKIKLVRTGKKNQPQYRFIVQEGKSKLSGTHVANLGYYNPLTDPAIVTLDIQKYLNWIKKGAQPTDSVRTLVNKHFKSKLSNSPH